MGRHKIKNPKSERVMIRMDVKLRKQLCRQAGGKGKVSAIARQAIIMFLKLNK